MKKCPYMVIYWTNLYCNHAEHRINYPTAEEALKESAYQAACFWVHRVEVWKEDFRLLLAVH
jgi:hypothetical protein